jgi:hypothetical protein
VGVRRDVDDAVALLDAERLQGGRPPIAALEELFVREALVAVNDGFTRRIQATRTTGELEGCERNLQANYPPAAMMRPPTKRAIMLSSGRNILRPPVGILVRAPRHDDTCTARSRVAAAEASNFTAGSRLQASDSRDRKAQVIGFAREVNRRNLMAWVQLLLLLLVAIALPGCEVVGGIFKAGAWVGALAVILIIAIIGILAAKIRG